MDKKKTSEKISDDIFDLKNVKISFYNKISTPQDTITHTLEEVFNIIKSDKHKKHTDYLRSINDIKYKKTRQKYKYNNLNCVVFQGKFSYRSMAKIQKASGISCLDIDDYKGDMVTLKNELKKNKYVIACFISPSGGLKILVRIPIIDTDAKYKIIFANLIKEFEKYNPNQDEKNKDISRACYLTYDNDIYINYNAAEYPINWGIEIKKAEKEERELIKKNKGSKIDLDKNLQGVKEDNRNTTGFRLACRQRSLNVTKGEVILFISKWNEKNIPPLSNDEIRKVVDSAFNYSNIDKFKNYDLKKDLLGYIFTKKIKRYNKHTKEDEEIIVELSDFDKIENQEQSVYDITTGATKINNEFHFVIRQKDYTAKNEIQFKNILLDSKRSGSRTQFYRSDEFAFIEKLKHFPKVNVKKTNCYGFVDNKYIDYNNYKLYNSIYEKKGSELIYKTEYTNPDEKYIEFMKLKNNDNEIINKIKDLLNNKIPRTNEEKVYYKNILSWSISSVLKQVIRRKGIKLDPLLVVLGAKRKGKTTCMELCISYLWNTIILSSDNFEGAKGARLKQVGNNLFPMYCDELKTLDHYSEILKNSTIHGHMNIPRGKKDGSYEENRKFFNFSLSANNYKISDIAFKDRMIIFNYAIKSNTKTKANDLDIKWLCDNIKYLGKKIYDEFINLDLNKWIDELQEELKDYMDRDRYKLIYIKLGSKVLEHFGILKDTIIENDFIISNNEDVSVSQYDTLKNIIKGIINSIVYRKPGKNDDEEEILTISNALENNNLNNNLFELMRQKGVFFSGDFEKVIITGNILPLINDKLSRIKSSEYKSLFALSTDLETKYNNKRLYNTKSPMKSIEVFTKKEFLEQ